MPSDLSGTALVEDRFNFVFFWIQQECGKVAWMIGTKTGAATVLAPSAQAGGVECVNLFNRTRSEAPMPSPVTRRFLRLEHAQVRVGVVLPCALRVS